MDRPNLSQHQYAVGQAEFSTGHVLKNDRSLFLTGDDIKDAFEIFNSYDQAKGFCFKKVQDNPEIECYIYDYAGQVIFVYDKNGERNFKKIIITSPDK